MHKLLVSPRGAYVSLVRHQELGSIHVKLQYKGRVLKSYLSSGDMNTLVKVWKYYGYKVVASV